MLVLCATVGAEAALQQSQTCTNCVLSPWLNAGPQIKVTTCNALQVFRANTSTPQDCRNTLPPALFAKLILTHVVDIILDISALPTTHNACSTWGAWVAGRLGSAGGHPSNKPTPPPALLQLTVFGARWGVLGPGERPAGVAEPVQPSHLLAATATVVAVSEDVHAHLAAHLLVSCSMSEARELCGYTGNAGA